ncbi:hypothetical protein SVXNc_0534 [Candidatus Nanohalococcus occultus]|uniref:Uncharacterized protein n=2 Tax=Candidatus Nanohalococcus occultus TaxID=2978047 RepID=A0ABY8CED0_9ARCH|nr:hypothetical protein SVXNc_0534 [Candidatus Nanohaloarchaeota archaeon SVXNc]
MTTDNGDYELHDLLEMKKVPEVKRAEGSLETSSSSSRSLQQTFGPSYGESSPEVYSEERETVTLDDLQETKLDQYD